MFVPTSKSIDQYLIKPHQGTKNPHQYQLKTTVKTAANLQIMLCYSQIIAL